MHWTEYSLFALTFLTAAFAVYRSFTKPDEDAKLAIAVINNKLLGVQKDVAKILSNDLPHIDAKVELVHQEVVSVRLAQERLGTIIEERIPRK